LFLELNQIVLNHLNKQTNLSQIPHIMSYMSTYWYINRINHQQKVSAVNLDKLHYNINLHRLLV